MQLGMIGLGRMGAGLTRRLMADGHEVAVNDVNADAIAALASEGAIAAPSVTDFLTALEASTTYELMGDRLTLRNAEGAMQVTIMRPVN